MHYLLDTHAFVWFINGEVLPENVIDKIKNIDNKIYLSMASIWEMAIKHSLGKLELQAGFDNITAFLINNDIELFPIAFTHIQQLLKLEMFHSDPFDRIIISQGIYENLTVLTKDNKFDYYNVKTNW